MGQQPDTLNLSAIEYSRSVAPQIAALCEPFLETLGLTTFLYGRIYEDGRYLLLSNNVGWITNWFQNVETISHSVLQTVLQNVSYEEPFYFLWSTVPQDGLIQMHNTLNIWHGFDISFRLENSVEGWSFSTTQDCSQINYLYMNKIKLFHLFILYFREKAASLFDWQDQKNLAVFPKSIDITFKPFLSLTEKVNNFLPSLLLDGYHVKTSNGYIKISKRELDCLFYLSHGKTSKEIGRLLSISPRTVESYLMNLKLKTNHHNKSALVDFFKNQVSQWMPL